MADEGDVVQYEMQIGNEFALVRIRKVSTRNGERLEIEAPKLGHTIRLDAVALETLTWQEPELFSTLLESGAPPPPGPR
jgi:hypothetical protein